MASRTGRLATLLFTVALLAAACGGEADVETDPDENGIDATVDVDTPTADGDGDGDGGTPADALTMIDNEFEPADFEVAAGEEFQLINEGAVLHNFTVEGTSIDVDVEPDESASVTADLDAGEYEFICEYHQSIGMNGTLTVTG